LIFNASISAILNSQTILPMIHYVGKKNLKIPKG